MLNQLFKFEIPYYEIYYDTPSSSVTMIDSNFIIIKFSFKHQLEVQILNFDGFPVQYVLLSNVKRVQTHVTGSLINPRRSICNDKTFYHRQTLTLKSF